MQASDRFNINSQLEHLQASKWAAHISRDMYASYIGRHPMLAYIAISENESIGREQYNFMQKLTRPRHYYMPDGSDTDTSGSDDSDTDTSGSDDSDTDTSVSDDSDTDTSGSDDSDTDTSRIVSDNEPSRDNISDTANTVSNTPPISQSVQSSPCQIAEAVLADPEEFSDPNSVSDSGPYHDNMRDTSYTEVSRTAASETPVSQSVLSSPCGIAEAVLADPEEFSDPDSVSDTGPYHDNMPDTSYTEVSKTASDTPVSQSVPSSPGIVRKVRTVQELYETTQVVSDPNSVSETGPYHDDMFDTSYTKVPKTTSSTPVSQSLPSSPCGIENASPLQTPSRER